MQFITFLHILGLILTTLLVMAGAFMLKGRFVKSMPNEWMIIMRDGKLVKLGIGISSYVGWYDTVVRFPSQINKVSFTMKQLTSENQFLEISGVLLWSIYRADQGPFLAYQKLGEDLRKGKPEKANEDLRDATYSILRERIANSTVMEIIQSRHKIRDVMKKELNGLVNNWGVWIENVEITDVKIISNELFKNLQTEFREKTRKNAEMIQMEVNTHLNKIRTQNNLEYNKLREENRVKITIAQNEKAMKLENDNKQVFENNLKIQEETDKIRKDYNIIKKEHEYSYYKKKNNIDAEIKELNTQYEIEKLNKSHENEMFGIETEMKIAEYQVECDEKQENFEREILFKKMEAENEAYTGNALNLKLLENVEQLYKCLPNKNLRIIDFGNQKSDPVIGNLAQAIQSLDVVKEAIK